MADRGETHLITVGNGVLVHEQGVAGVTVDATVRLPRPILLATLLAGAAPEPLIASGQITIDGDASLFAALTGLIEPVVSDFAVVTP